MDHMKFFSEMFHEKGALSLDIRPLLSDDALIGYQGLPRPRERGCWMVQGNWPTQCIHGAR